MDPLIIGAAASALIGGIGSIIGGTSANRANLKINREQIAYDREKMRSQMAWQEKMWNAENAYNTPSMQRQRLEQAGINPYFALSNISPGMAQSAGAAPSGGAPAQIPVQPVDYGALGRGLADSVQQYFAMRNAEANTRNINAQARSQEIANKFKVIETLSDLSEKWSKVKANRGAAHKALAEARQILKDSDWTSERVRIGAARDAREEQYFGELINSEQVKQDLMRSEIGVNDKKAAEIAQSIVESASRVAVNFAQVGYINEKSRTEKEYRYKLKSEARKIVWDTFGYSNDASLNERRIEIIERMIDSQVRLNDAKTMDTYSDIPTGVVKNVTK